MQKAETFVVSQTKQNKKKTLRYFKLISGNTMKHTYETRKRGTGHKERVLKIHRKPPSPKKQKKEKFKEYPNV